MSPYFIFEKLGISLLLGLLVGLQREKAQSSLGGFRTFPLATIFGTLCGLIAQTYGGNFLAAALIGLIVLILMGNLSLLRSEERSGGITTEISLLIMFAVGVYLVAGSKLVAVVIGGGVAVLLQYKPELHGFASRLGDADLKAIMRFVLLSFIILPILPNEAFGPFEVLNPHEIWLMVVFIVGLNLIGYIVSKFVGPSAGTFTSGILGGLISSTATTLSFTQSARRGETSLSRATTVILIASTFVYLRVLLETAAVSNTLFNALLAPLSAWFAFSLLLALGSHFLSKEKQTSSNEPQKPGGVRSALIFGVTYVAVVVVTAAAKKYLGPGSLYWVAAISGVTDVDAITLSTARLVTLHQLAPEQGREMILLGTLTNLAFKTGIVAFSGNAKLALKVGGLLSLCIAFGVLLFWLF